MKKTNSQRGAAPGSKKPLAPTPPIRAKRQPGIPKKGTVPKLDPKERPSVAFNLRLNKYQLELLRAAAERDHRSMQQQAIFILLQGLEVI